MATFQQMHVSIAKNRDNVTTKKVWLPDKQTDTRTLDKVIPICNYASQAKQKVTKWETNIKLEDLAQSNEV